MYPALLIVIASYLHCLLRALEKTRQLFTDFLIDPRATDQQKVLKVKVLGLTRIPPGAVCDWVERQLDRVQNPACAAPVVCKENEPCHTDAMTHQSGGPVSQTQKAAELDALLVQLTGAKPMPSKPSGSSKPTRRGSGGRK